MPPPNPQPFDYGTWGVTVDHTFTVSNAGNQTAASIADGAGLGNGFSFAGGAYPGSGGDCGTTLASGATCNIVVRFTPSGSGPRSSTIKLNYTDLAAAPMPSATRDVTGTATIAALLMMMESVGGCGEGCGPFDFGSHTVGTTAEMTFNVFNSGGGSATVMTNAGTLGLPFSFKGGAYPGTGGSCGATLAAGNACQVVVQFGPTSAVTSNSVIAVDYNNGQGQTPRVQRSLRGTGTP
jgi:hypothetical protein